MIADPGAGHGRTHERILAVRRAIEARGLEHDVFVADGAGDATRLATRALDDGFRFLAAVGDDRTVQDVLNGMFRDGRPIVPDPVLAVLPVADCDLVRSFGLPSDPVDASMHLLGEETYPFDVMKVASTGKGGERTIRYGHNLAEIGLHAAARTRELRLPISLGSARRFVGFWGAYVTQRVRNVHLVVDTKTDDLRAWGFVVGNGQFTAGGLRLSPRSFPGDGIVDVLAFTGPKTQAYRMLPKLFRHGDHIPDPEIRESRAKITVSIIPDRPMPVVVDGVAFGTTPVTVQVVPQPILLKL